MANKGFKERMNEDAPQTLQDEAGAEVFEEIVPRSEKGKKRNPVSGIGTQTLQVVCTAEQIEKIRLIVTIRDAVRGRDDRRISSSSVIASMVQYYLDTDDGRAEVAKAEKYAQALKALEKTD